MWATLADIETHATGLRFVLVGGLTIHLLEFSNIDSVTECEWHSPTGWGVYSFCNRLTGRVFLISMKTGWFARRVKVTPEHPLQFIEHLRKNGVQVFVRSER